MAPLLGNFALKPPKVKCMSLRAAKIHLTSFQQEAVCFHRIFLPSSTIKLLAVISVILLTFPKSWFMMTSSLKFCRAQRADFSSHLTTLVPISVNGVSQEIYTGTMSNPCRRDCLVTVSAFILCITLLKTMTVSQTVTY